MAATGPEFGQTDPPLSLVYAFYERVRRKGPGSEDSTLQTLSLLNDLPAEPQIVEFGCGAGVATLPIARSRRCHLTAVDLHQPFLDELMAEAMREGLAERITPIRADMGKPSFPDGSFDLIWSESAIYNIGFEAGLRLWKRLLRPGGYIAVSEAVWLTSDPPRRAKEFWDAEYPAMTTVDENLNQVRSAGFTPVDYFILPVEDWRNYYDPLQKHLNEFRSQHSGDVAAQTFSDSIQREIDLWQAHGDSFGYCFFLGRAGRI